MQAGVTGVLTDYEGRVLLIQGGPNTLTPVHRPLEPGVLPATTLDRAFREETGLIVMPVRLTGVYFDVGTTGGKMAFCFRCIMRGGDLQVPPGGSPAGFFDCPPLPGSLSREYRRQVDTALHHAGGPPEMEQISRLSTRLGRLLGRREATAMSADWQVMIRIETGEAGDDVDWVVAGSHDLNGSLAMPTDPGQAPWKTAARLIKTQHPGGEPAVRLLRVELAAARPALTLVFAPAGR